MREDIDLTRCSWEQFDAVPGWVVTPQARELLNLTGPQLAALLGVHPKTVYRWERDPAVWPDAARELDGIARRVLFWMLRPGRPDVWALPGGAVDE